MQENQEFISDFDGMSDVASFLNTHGLLPKANLADADHALGQINPLSILVVEDNIINQKVALRMLERMGYNAGLAQNGQEAVDAVATNHYDLIFMDIQMPVMDGIQATMTLKKLYPDETCPKIVAMTAHALPQDRRAGFQCGMFDYLVKPVCVGELVRVLNKVFELKAA